jgi:NarL family two-component system response regulator LiaR
MEIKNYLIRYQNIIIYSICLAALFLLLRFLEYRLLIIDYSMEIYAGSIALLFLLLGIWLARKLTKPKKEITIIEKEIFVPVNQTAFVLNEKAVASFDISRRELEVLELVAMGKSNREIAAELFVSLSTVKTHMANLFFKLDVTRRTQAVNKAKQLGLVP